MIFILQQHREFTAVKLFVINWNNLSSAFKRPGIAWHSDLTGENKMENLLVILWYQQKYMSGVIWSKIPISFFPHFSWCWREVKERAGELDWEHQSDQDTIISTIRLHIFQMGIICSSNIGHFPRDKNILAILAFITATIFLLQNIYLHSIMFLCCPYFPIIL